MKAFEIIMTLILVASVVYIVWCMFGTAKFLRENGRKPEKTFSKNDNK